MVFENFSEVCFRYCEGSFVFDIVKFQKSPVGIINTQIQSTYLFTLALKSVP